MKNRSEKNRGEAKKAGRSRREGRGAGRAWLALAAVLALALIGVGIRTVYQRFNPPSIETYIVEYEDLIRKYANENGIAPAYVASVVLAESSYRADAVSSVNAQGLMQILPSTGEWIAGKFSEKYTDGCLFDPDTNLRYGCWYLGYLMRRYDGNMRCSSSAYHAGQGTVDKWLQDERYSADGRTLKDIPYDTTRTYVDRVLKYYENYRKIYA